MEQSPACCTTIMASQGVIHHKNGSTYNNGEHPSSIGDGSVGLIEADKRPSEHETSSTKEQVTNGSSQSSHSTTLKVAGKKRKRLGSPFRIKVGCLVAIRYSPGGNSIVFVKPNGMPAQEDEVPPTKMAFSEVWSDPLPGRDQGFALIGRRVRCCFPKSVLKTKYGPKQQPATQRIIEGEIVALRQGNGEGATATDVTYGFHVDLLVDDKGLEALPFLEREETNVNVDVLDKKSKRRHQMEEIIRGKNKVIVKAILANVSSLSNAKNNDSKGAPIGRWVIRKRVPTKLAPSPLLPGVLTVNRTTSKENPSEESELNGDRKDGATETDSGPNVVEGSSASTSSTQPDSTNDKAEKIEKDTEASTPKLVKKIRNRPESFTAARFCGDGNDASEQQQKNWRWAAGKFDMFQNADFELLPPDVLECLSYGFVGEVVKIEAGVAKDSLAAVTLKRLILPEQTRSGRRPRDSAFTVYDSAKSIKKAESNGDHEQQQSPQSEEVFYQVPVESLVIISRSIDRRVKDESIQTHESSDVFVVSENYSYDVDTYCLLNTLHDEAESGSSAPTFEVRCHRCQVFMTKLFQQQTGNQQQYFCDSCQATLKANCALGETDRTRDYLDVCDCDQCKFQKYNQLHESLVDEISSSSKVVSAGAAKRGMGNAGSKFATLSRAHLAVKHCNPINFTIGAGFLGNAASSAKSSTRVKKPPTRKPKFRKQGIARGQIKEDKELADVQSAHPMEESDDEQQPFRPTSARLFPYSVKKRNFECSDEEILCWAGRKSRKREKVRNLRLLMESKDIKKKKKEAKKKPNGRAVRASQRRLVRNVSAFGVSVDTLAGREQQLRFDRSGIHAWGVFADVDVPKDEMIMEYRGEIIENAMAEKREKEYEEAKIGSDYMFRIDGLSVCDATKQGNMARFINASCDPNCYTKIIVIDGSDRIVVYAKRDIKAGEELCYDYKFPLEYDASKRIPCHCGAKECRGFMNWNKKYVAVPLGGNAGQNIKDSAIKTGKHIKNVDINDHHLYGIKSGDNGGADGNK